MSAIKTRQNIQKEKKERLQDSEVSLNKPIQGAESMYKLVQESMYKLVQESMYKLVQESIEVLRSNSSEVSKRLAKDDIRLDKLEREVN